MMGDLDPSVLWDLAKRRHGDYLREAAADQLLRGAGSAGPGLRQRLSVAVGDRLIALGLRLKQRYDPQLASGHLYGRSSP